MQTLTQMRKEMGQLTEEDTNKIVDTAGMQINSLWPSDAIWWQILVSIDSGNGLLPDKTKWVSEWFSLTAFLRTADIVVHIVHTSCVIIAYTLKSLSSLT